MGDCRYCGESAGFLRRQHRTCADAFRRGEAAIRDSAARAARRDAFRESALLNEAQEIANRSFMDELDIRAAIAAGWRAAVRESLSDGVLGKDEEARLRGFRDRMALGAQDAGPMDDALDEAAAARLRTDARTAALAVDDGAQIDAFATALDESAISSNARRSLLIRAWEAAVESSFEDGCLSLDEEQALVRYLRRFGLSAHDVDGNGAHHTMVQGAVIREAAEGIVPDRLGDVRVPFNLMKSEQLVWLIDDVDYLEVKVRRERRGTSHGLSIRVARGVYYRPGMFRSQPIEWEETVHEDTGLLGITTKHIYFHGSRKRFRVRYDRIVSFDPYDDGIGIMRDAQTAKPQTFRTGDGWFVYNLVTNLASR